MSRLGVIEETAPQRCELCGQEAETRPYGPKGEEICFRCAMKDPQTTEAQAGRHLFGIDTRTPEAPSE